MFSFLSCIRLKLHSCSIPVCPLRRFLPADLRSVFLWQPDQWPAVHDVEPQIGQVTQRPEVVDDFIRNFLVKMGLSKTLEMFETEWYTCLAFANIQSLPHC